MSTTSEVERLRAENKRLRELLDTSVPVPPPVAWVCACDKPDQRCSVHGWVARAGSAR